jgi:hypothetical protein
MHVDLSPVDVQKALLVSMTFLFYACGLPDAFIIAFSNILLKA